MLANSEKIIRNGNIPSCRNCKYYKPEYYSDFISTINKCEKTGVKDIYTDKIIYDYADLSRKDEKLCGFKGRYVEEEKYANLKVFKYELIKNIPYFAIFTLVVTLFIKPI
jgi:hypothetical protein